MSASAVSALELAALPPVRPFQLWIGRPCQMSVQSGSVGTTIAVRLSTKSPSQVPEVPALSRPELPAELKKRAPAAFTVFTAFAITPSWNAASLA